MGIAALLIGSVLTQSSAGLSFSAPVTYYDIEYGSTLELLGDTWEFRIIGRKGFLNMLSSLHGQFGFSYEVRWGNPDVLRIKRNDKETEIELALRRVLPALDLTYRIDRGLIVICARPIPEFSDGLASTEIPYLGKRSLDPLARTLSERGIGYRVEGARSAVVDLHAPCATLRQMVWIVQELDPNIVIEERSGIVIRNRYYYR